MIEITVKYQAGHSYKEIWKASDYFCPYCGSRKTFDETGEGDYYLGTQSICIDCDSSFYIPAGGKILLERGYSKADFQRLTTLKGASK